MGCASSRSEGTRASQHHGCCSCCGCCGCCIAPPHKAVLYDDIDESDSLVLNSRPVKVAAADMSECQQSQLSELSNVKPVIRDLPCLPGGSRGAIGQEGVNGASLPKCHSSLALNGSDLKVGTGSDTDTACENTAEGRGARTVSALPASPELAPVGLCVPASRSMPPIPGLHFCMSVGMNAHSLKALRAHLRAKGFGPVDGSNPRAPAVASDIQTGADPSTSTTHPTARWQSSHSMHSCCTPHANPTNAPDLAANSWAALHDASSQYQGSPQGSIPSAADTWRDFGIPDDELCGSDTASSADGDEVLAGVGHGHVEGGSDDGQSTASFCTARSPSAAPFRRTRSFPASRTASLASTAGTEAQPCSPPAQAPVPGAHSARSRHMGAAPGSKSWAANVHMAQANVATEDLAHVNGGDTHPALEAFKRGRLSFAFSGGGFFFPYHLGCVIQLKDMGIITEATPLAGASCGSIIIACVNSGLDLHKLVDRLLEFAADCRDYGTAGRLKGVIVKFMTANLPADAHLRCRSRTYISLTKVFPYLHPYIISDYTSKEDLVHAIATSCHIPAYNDGSFMARFRNHWFVDGGLTRHIPALPAEVGASYVAGVSCVPFKFLEALPGISRLQLLHSLAVSPDMFGTFPFQWHEVGGLVLAPAEDPVLLRMVEMGKRDVLAWARAVGLTAHLSGTRTIPPSLSPAPSTVAEAMADAGRAARRHRRHPPSVTVPTPSDRTDYGPTSFLSAASTAVSRFASSTAPLTPNTPATSLGGAGVGGGASQSQPGGLPPAMEDDWHDAMEEQSAFPPQHYHHEQQQQQHAAHADKPATNTGQGVPAGQGVARRSVARRKSNEDPEEAAREGLVAAAGAVAGPLHMDPQQAVGALAGMSTLGLAQAAAAASQELPDHVMSMFGVREGRAHRGSLDLPATSRGGGGGPQRGAMMGLQVLHVKGGKWRGAPGTAGSVSNASSVANVSEQARGAGAGVSAGAGAGTGVSAGAGAGASVDLPHAARLSSAPAAALQSCALDIDVDVPDKEGVAEVHTVHVTACVNGQPVLFELRLHMPHSNGKVQATAQQATAQP